MNESELVAVDTTSTAPSLLNQFDMVDVKHAAAVQKNFGDLVEALLDDNDYQGGKKKKSAWRKLARAFNISDEPITKEIIRDENHQIISAYFEVKAILPNGRSGFGVGDCSIFDKIKSSDTELPSNFELRKRFTNAEHDVIATAHTRAKSRAIADLIGAGEVSAEELEGLSNKPKSPKPVKPSAPKPSKPKTKGQTSTMGRKPKIPPTKEEVRQKAVKEGIVVEAEIVETPKGKKEVLTPKKSFKEICDSNPALTSVVQELQATGRTINSSTVGDKLIDFWDIGKVTDEEYQEAKKLLE